jgi:hypothetical protein
MPEFAVPREWQTTKSVRGLGGATSPVQRGGRRQQESLMSVRSPVEILKRQVQAIGIDRDLDAFLEHFAHDCVLRDMAEPGPRVGRHGLRDYMNADLDAAGGNVTVWNRSPNKAQALATVGANVASSVAETITASPIAVLCLGDTFLIGRGA